MDNSLNISEIFFGIQGEGRYCGTPALFVRLSGCTRACDWCDTKYHMKGRYYTFEELNSEIDAVLPEVTVWTGGEPLKQFKLLEDFLLGRDGIFARQHVETNGDLIASGEVELQDLGIFEYVCCSPKSKDVAKDVFTKLSSNRDTRLLWDIKVVTDLITVGTDMLKQATILMPHTSGFLERDRVARKRVWEYCVKNRIKYSPRLHIEVFGQGMRGV